jgi:SAM-dependent methyltransferase
MEYLGTFPAGFTDLVKRLIVRDAASPHFLFSDESSIAFRSERVLPQLAYLKNLYPLIAWGKAENLTAAYQLVVEKPLRQKLTPMLGSPLRYNFVIRVFLEGRPGPIIRDLHLRLEQQLAQVLGGRPDSERPDIELQLHLRKNHQCYFILQKTKGLTTELPPGTLPPYLCRLLLELSELQRDDIFLDPFMGSGAIPLERARMGPYHMIFAGDINPEKVERFKAVLKDKPWEKRRKTIFPKVLDATHLEKFEDGFFTRLVSDPPWGLYDALGPEELRALYINFLREASRVLAKTGKMVLLVGADVPLADLLREAKLSLSVADFMPVLVSGQKALVYVIIPE